MVSRRRRCAWCAGFSALLLSLGGCVLVPTDPVAGFSVTPVVLYAGESFRLDASSSQGGAGITSYSWTLSDGQTLVGQRVDVTLAHPGTYEVRLTVQDAQGRTGQSRRTIVVYARSGTVLLDESFSDGERALVRWSLDPTWASEGDARIDRVAGAPGHALYIRSAATRWHRRYRPIELPPLRTGQKVVFSCRIMTHRNQDFHTFLFAPGRVSVDSLAGALPFLRFTNEGGGTFVHTPSALGTDLARPVSHVPDVYRWHTYRFEFDHDGYALHVDGERLQEGSLSAPFHDTSRWVIVIGEESLTETCNAYYDEILVTIQE